MVERILHETTVGIYYYEERECPFANSQKYHTFEVVNIRSILCFTESVVHEYRSEIGLLKILPNWFDGQCGFV